MNRLLKVLFFALIIRPLVLIVLGLNIYNRKKLPSHGPAIIAANHNSHLDAMVLMSLYPLLTLHKIRPVAASDYFLKNRFNRWFFINVIGIIPLDRKAKSRLNELFAGCHQALDRGDVIILFPEGTRGNPEEISKLKRGLFHIVKDRSDTLITPVVMHGLGRTLPRGEALLVPFNCDVVAGNPLSYDNDPKESIQNLTNIYTELFEYCLTRQD